MSDVYSEREIGQLVPPIRLELDQLPCDRLGCDASGYWLVPGASLCWSCAAEFGIGVVDVYDVPLGELCGDSRWRRARRDLYEEIVADWPPMRREEHHDRALAQLVESPVDEAIFGDE